LWLLSCTAEDGKRQAANFVVVRCFASSITVPWRGFLTSQYSLIVLVRDYR